jgi:hypothetical protein
MNENFASIASGVGGAVITGLAWLSREWWTARKSQRADAEDSANSKAGLTMLADAQRERQESFAREALANARIAELISQQEKMREGFADERDRWREQIGKLRGDLYLIETKLRLSYARLSAEEADQIETTKPAPLGDH